MFANNIKGSFQSLECIVCHTKEATVCISKDGKQGNICNDCKTYVNAYGWDKAGSLASERSLPPDLFSLIEGYDEIKQVFIMALKASEPVHVLLEGPPFSGKSIFMLEIERAGAGRMELGPNITNAGLVRYIIENRPKLLIIDEIEEARPHQLDTLYGLMSETPIISELKTGRTHSLSVKTKVFAACNDSSRLPEKLLTRFFPLKLPRYTDEQFLQITINILMRMEGKSQEIAERIAFSMLRELGRDNIRIAVKIGRMCQTIEQVNYVFKTLQKYC